jgi:hypothetical protein
VVSHGKENLLTRSSAPIRPNCRKVSSTKQQALAVGQLPRTSSGTAAWNGSWNGPPRNPLVLGAAVALSCGIGAGSGPKAREHASCKRQVSGSNPLTGSTSIPAKMPSHLGMVVMSDTSRSWCSMHGSHNLGSRLSAAKRPAVPMCARSDGS